MPDLVLGPLLRYADETDATVWVETDAACEVEVLGRRSRTFRPRLASNSAATMTHGMLGVAPARG